MNRYAAYGPAFLLIIAASGSLKAQQMVTPAEAEAVKQQIARCWAPPALPPGNIAPDLIVDITADMAPDGRVLAARVTSTARMGDPAYRASAESALRAVLNPQCSPLKLPPEKYEQWKTIYLKFNPKDMMP